MKGKPKFEYGDKVRFECDGETKSGVIAIVDAFGTFQDPTDVRYDIYSEKENILYKHVTEKLVSHDNRNKI